MVAFQSDADLLAKGVPGTHVYLLDRDQAAPNPDAPTDPTQTVGLVQITDVPGASTKPSLGRGSWYLIFVSDADVLRNGSSGQHVFLYDVRSEMKFQLTDKIVGSTDNPRATGDTIFFFDSSEDLMHTGITGRQVYALNVFGALPSASPRRDHVQVAARWDSWGGSAAPRWRRATPSIPRFLGNGQHVPALRGAPHRR